MQGAKCLSQTHNRAHETKVPHRRSTSDNKLLRYILFVGITRLATQQGGPGSSSYMWYAPTRPSSRITRPGSCLVETLTAWPALASRAACSHARGARARACANGNGSCAHTHTRPRGGVAPPRPEARVIIMRRLGQCVKFLWCSFFGKQRGSKCSRVLHDAMRREVASLPLNDMDNHPK